MSWKRAPSSRRLSASGSSPTDSPTWRARLGGGRAERADPILVDPERRNRDTDGLGERTEPHVLQILGLEDERLREPEQLGGELAAEAKILHLCLAETSDAPGRAR